MPYVRHHQHLPLLRTSVIVLPRCVTMPKCVQPASPGRYEAHCCQQARDTKSEIRPRCLITRGNACWVSALSCHPASPRQCLLGTGVHCHRATTRQCLPGVGNFCHPANTRHSLLNTGIHCRPACTRHCLLGIGISCHPVSRGQCLQGFGTLVPPSPRLAKPAGCWHSLPPNHQEPFVYKP